MVKVKVYIEEHLVKEVVVDCPDNMDINERMDYAEEKVVEQYKNKEIVLTTDDYSGITLKCVEDIETGASTEWKEI